MITKNKEDLQLNKEGQEIDANTSMTEMLDLFDKDFKVAILKMLQSAVMILKNRKFQQRNRKHKEEPNKTSGTKNKLI